MCIICTNEYDETITVLKCCGNVSKIPNTLINLKKLNCSDTKIKEIPDILTNLQRLICWDTNI